MPLPARFDAPLLPHADLVVTLGDADLAHLEAVTALVREIDPVNADTFTPGALVSFALDIAAEQARDWRPRLVRLREAVAMS